jgi:hypothetical protein
MRALEQIESFKRAYSNDIIATELATIRSLDNDFSVESIELAIHQHNQEKEFSLLLVAGVHGLEWIGVTVLLHFLSHLIETTKWNSDVRNMLSKARVVAIPALNPTGLARQTRSTHEGIDLMRNAPISAESPIPFLGGQTFSPLLPYYKGTGELASESKALISTVQRLLRESKGLIALDLHSGFGARDRIWTPWAMSTALPPHWKHYMQLEETLNNSFPSHVYKFEKQSDSYQTDGDLWDYVLYEAMQQSDQLFMPLTLEMGSWNWLKKAPWQVFSKTGWFHPKAPHRVQRVCRRHITLLDFLVSVCANGSVFFSDRER